jgi:hypothetical protein
MGTSQTLPEKATVVNIINLVSLALFTTLLCLPGILFAARSIMPTSVQMTVTTIALVVVLNLGIPICAVGFVSNLVLISRRHGPLWLKAVTTLFVFLAILGTLEARTVIPRSTQRALTLRRTRLQTHSLYGPVLLALAARIVAHTQKLSGGTSCRMNRFSVRALACEFAGVGHAKF